MPLIVLKVGRMLVHQVVTHLHRIETSTGDQSLDATRWSLARKAKEAHLALVAEALKGFQPPLVQHQDVLTLVVPAPVKLDQVDHIGAQPDEALLDALPDALRCPVAAAHLRGEDHIVAPAR